jgi:hypothetical protein
LVWLFVFHRAQVLIPAPPVGVLSAADPIAGSKLPVSGRPVPFFICFSFLPFFSL